MSAKQVSQTTTTQHEPGQAQRLFTFKATYIIWLLLILLEALLLFRIGLKLIGANPDNPFASFIYGFSHLFVSPFMGLTASPAAGGALLELSSVIALLAYALLGWALERIVWVVFYRPHEAAVAVTQQTSSEHLTP